MVDVDIGSWPFERVPPLAHDLGFVDCGWADPNQRVHLTGFLLEVIGVAASADTAEMIDNFPSPDAFNEDLVDQSMDDDLPAADPNAPVAVSRLALAYPEPMAVAFNDILTEAWRNFPDSVT